MIPCDYIYWRRPSAGKESPIRTFSSRQGRCRTGNISPIWFPVIQSLKRRQPRPEKLAHVLPPNSLINYVYGLSRKYSIYYLNPSFGYYFETFYLKPHGLVYQLQPYAKDAIEPPLPTSEEIKENQDIWAKLEQKSLVALPSLAKLDPDAELTGVSYSVGSGFLGRRSAKGRPSQGSQRPVCGGGADQSAKFHRQNQQGIQRTFAEKRPSAHRLRRSHL